MWMFDRSECSPINNVVFLSGAIPSFPDARPRAIQYDFNSSYRSSIFGSGSPPDIEPRALTTGSAVYDHAMKSSQIAPITIKMILMIFSMFILRNRTLRVSLERSDRL